MDSRGLTEDGEIRADLYQSLELPFFMGPYHYQQIFFLVQGLTAPRTNFSLISFSRSSGGLCGYPTQHSSVMASA